MDSLRLAEAVGVRQSSQDWILADEGAYFIDLNPVGQWLFLPSPVADAGTSMLAAWLDGCDDQ